MNEIMNSSQSSKVSLFTLLDSYHNVINSERIWKELEEGHVDAEEILRRYV